jgi:hypothetical protein
MQQDRLRLAGVLTICGALILSGCVKGTGAMKTHKMGEQAQAGYLIYTVYETEWKTQLGDGPTAKIPAARFLVLRLSVTNAGAQNHDIPQMVLLDQAGKAYPELPEAPGIADWLGIIRSVQPARTEEGRVVFDVPLGTYKLKVNSEPGADVESAGLVEIPLDFQGVPDKDKPMF